ncbi:MAG: winged helix-turn-helix domain-containing protein [Acidimicrobiales bacterium]
MVLILGLLSLLTTTVGAKGSRRDFDAMRRRRKAAGQMFARGKSQADVVTALSVSRQSASRWHAEWSEGGAAALHGAGRAGRMPKLDADQLKKVQRELKKGPGAHGYSTQLWTLARVSEVIEEATGVHYHPGYVWRVLHQLGWSRQRPARRAVERDDEAIARWVNEKWPRVKKTPDGGGRPSASKTKAASVSSPR